MIGRRLRLPKRTPDDAGISLVELIVVMGIFLAIAGVVTASIVQMMTQTRRETGQSDNLDNARKIIQSLDTSVRYANAITTPATAADGNYYVEWRRGNTGQQQTCDQLRYVPATKQVQARRWLPPLAGVGASTATAWVTQATGISLVGAQPIWSIVSTSLDNVHQELNVQFTVSHGVPVTSTESQVTLTAINTASSSPLTSSVCAEVGRS
jgi:type II secretory pathway pseudopilin PulG